MTPILISWSGGKDAAWSLHRLRQQGEFEPVALLTTVVEDTGRIAMHGIRREVLQAQAAALGLPVIEALQPLHPDNARYEASFVAALDEAKDRWPGIRHIAFGDLFLADVRAWRESLLGRHGWHGLFPLWGQNTASLAGEMLNQGLRARLCCVDTRQLDAGFTGRALDAELLAELPDAVDPCGENGEFHTVVEYTPDFTQPLELHVGLANRDEYGFEYLDFNLT